MRRGIWAVLVAVGLTAGCNGGSSTTDPGTGIDPGDSDVPANDLPEDPGLDLADDPGSPTDAPAGDALPGDPGTTDEPGSGDAAPDSGPTDPGRDPGIADTGGPFDAPPEDADSGTDEEVVQYLFLDCIDLTGCFEQCCEEQNPCPEECGTLCWSGASPEAREGWNAYTSCISDQCPSCSESPRPPDCDACEQLARQGACRTQTEQCYRFGQGTCREVVNCVLGCVSLETCRACLEDVSLDAQPWLDTLGQCLVGACPSGNPGGPTLPLTTCEQEALETPGVCAEPYANCLQH